MITIKSEDGDVLRYKIDTDEKSIEVDEATKQYLSDIALVTERNFRKIKDTYIFWYDDMSDSDIVELEEVFQTSLNNFADGGEISNELSLYVKLYYKAQLDSDTAASNDDYAASIRIDEKVDEYRKKATNLIDAYNKKNNTNLSLYKDFFRDGTLKEEISIKMDEAETEDRALDLEYIEDSFNLKYIDEDGNKIRFKDKNNGSILVINNYNNLGAWDAVVKHFDENFKYGGMMAKGGELENDTFVMLFEAYGFVEQRGSYGTRKFYNVEHNAQIYYDPKYRSISGYVGGGEGNDEVIPYSVDGVLDFFIEHDITESDATPFAEGGKVGGKKYKREKYVSIPVQVGDFFFDRPNAKSGYYNYRLVKSIDGKNTTVVIADRDYNGRISEKSNPFILQTKYVQNVIDDVRKEQFEKEQNIKEGVFNLSKEIGADKAKGGDLKIPKVRAQLYAILKKMASVETNVKDSSVGAAPNSMSFRASQSGTAISIDTNDVYRGGYYDGSTPYILQVKVGGALSYDKQKIVLTVLKSLLSKYTFTTELGSSRVKETDGTNWSSVMLTAPSSGSSYSPLRALNDFKSIRSLADGGMMADGGMISLSKYYKTLPNKELLVGLKVYDKINDEYIYIKDVDSGIWASKNKNDELGHYYKMSDLMIEDADDGMMADGGKVLDLKDVYYDLSNKVGRLQINDETDDYISCDIRDWGNWEHDYEDYERDEEDFEDDDSMILSDSSAKIMQDIVEQVRAKYPNALIKWNTSEKNYIDFNISRKMAAGGNVWNEDLNVYTLVSSKEYFGSDTASDKRRWFRRNGRGLSRDEAKRMAQGYIDRYGKENVYIGNVRHYR
jgi:hypothetical protein